MLSVLKIADVSGEPKVKLDLPGPLRNGDLVALKFRLERKNGGRYEVLDVNGRFRVTAVGFDASLAPHKQLLSVEAADVAPAWVAVKKPATVPRRLSPAVSPRTPVV
jgi:hypothetical protein